MSEIRVVLNILNARYLVLLEIKLFKIGKSVEARYLLDVISLKSNKRKIRQILQSLNSDKLVLRCMELGQIYECVDAFDLANLVITHIQDRQIYQSGQVFHLTDTVG